MHTSSEDITGKKSERVGKPAEIARILYPRLVELWIFLAIAVFFLIRVLGSHVGQSLLSRSGRQHLP